jgi:glycosyltransferase involved in cell wall biosynthesis
VDGIPTVIEVGIDGLLVEPENVEYLAVSLDKTMRDPQLRQRLGAQALARANAQFTAENYLENYSQLITAVVERS